MLLGPSVQTLDSAHFSSLLLDWYQAHKRDLPWRATSDPYSIWLSEIILQQTRVAQGLPYYRRFMVQYPSIQALAHASLEEILRLWQGLGYYARAKRMHACARMIVHELGGKFPNTYTALLRLPGMGPYTAAAIASMAFKEAVPVVDGNVYRVLSRVFGVEEDITSSRGLKVFYTLARSLVPPAQAATYNQALMEFGALHCTPALPKCTTCIFSASCVALRTKRQSTLPVKSKRAKVITRCLHYLVLQDPNALYMRQRGMRGIWGGLYDFYLVEHDRIETLGRLQDALVGLVLRHKLAVVSQPAPYKHLLTHQRLYIQFFQVQVTGSFLGEAMPLLHQAGLRSFSITQTKVLPKPVVIHNFLKTTVYT